jgi:hypothetical protein
MRVLSVNVSKPIAASYKGKKVGLFRNMYG